MKLILLIEPDYKNKYPPLGLMKISAYHKLKGDEVTFFKGCSKELKEQQWDRIYVTTLFSFYFNKTIKTIKYYRNSVIDLNNFFVGGILATTMYDELIQETGIIPFKGLLDRPGILGDDDIIVDEITPDYSILDEIDYKYPSNSAYFSYMTRGCCNHCPFCAVPDLEPKYKDYISIKNQIKEIKDKYGEKRNLLLMDNNVLASKRFNKIIDEIIELGFYKGAKYTYIKNGRKISVNRYIDFNQGIDARLLTEGKMKRLAEINIRPLRIAFDDIKIKDLYIEKVKLARKYGIKSLSNYILYNYKDTPEELYERLKINIKLNIELGLKIYSFPMKYIPIDAKKRKHLGPNWNRKYIRTIQSILHATHGVVSPKKKFFNKAFGKDLDTFRELLLMPEDYIIYREYAEEKGLTNDWRKKLKKIKNKSNFDFIMDIVFPNKFKNLPELFLDKEDFDFLYHYSNRINVDDYKSWKEQNKMSFFQYSKQHPSINSRKTKSLGMVE